MFAMLLPKSQPLQGRFRPEKACDTEPTAEAALDYGLSQRALIDVSGRTGDVAE
jgi:hypothetical protein